MADEFAPHTGISWQQGETVGVVNYGNDRNLVLFYLRPVPDPEKSKETGRPWKKNQTFVRVQAPGERWNIVDRPATGEDARRWPIQWAQFKQNQDQIPEGTPIDLLYPSNPAIADTLKANGVYTIEQCAGMSGSAIDAVGMGAQAWVNAAVKFIEASNKGVKASQLQAELDKRDRENSALKHQLETVLQRLKQIEDSQQNKALAAAQALIAGQMVRPEHQPLQAFDAQVAQINANSPTKLKSQARRQRPRLAR